MAAQDPNFVTQFLSIWGAIVATVALTWNIVRDLLKRDRLIVDVTVARMIPDPTEQVYITLTVTNAGDDPVMVKAWRGELRGKRKGSFKGFMISPNPPKAFPKRLERHEWLNAMTAEIGYWREAVEADDLAAVYVEDSTNRRWKLSRKRLAALKKQLLELSPETLQRQRMD